MKNILTTILVACLALSTPSCETYSKVKATLTTATTYQTSPETADQILIRSEQLTRQALITFDTYLYVEHNNQALLATYSPSFHATAVKIQKNGKAWILKARVATKTFKANRTEANTANMRTAYATLKSLYDEVQAQQAKTVVISNNTP